jgi:hypothetical protein
MLKQTTAACGETTALEQQHLWHRKTKGTFDLGLDSNSGLQHEAEQTWLSCGLSRCFGVCLVRPRRELCVRWNSIGHKDEEAVLCVNFVTSYPVPWSTRRTGVFIDFRASDASSA